jgi:hypothetical protein
MTAVNAGALALSSQATGDWMQASSASQWARVQPYVPLLTLNTTAVGNVGSGEDNLMTFAVAAGLLGTNGWGLEILAAFQCAANANNKTIKLYFGGTGPFMATLATTNPLPDGRIPARVAGEALARHRSQGFGNLGSSPWFLRPQSLQLVKSVVPFMAEENDLFRGLPVEGEVPARVSPPERPAVAQPMKVRFLPRRAVSRYEEWVEEQGIGAAATTFEPDVPVVAGAYCYSTEALTREEDKRIVAGAWDVEFFKAHYTFPAYTLGQARALANPLLEVDWLGLGFALVRTEVFAKIEYPWFNSELIVIDDLRDTTSEDVGWCRKVNRAGYKILLDPSVKVGHLKGVQI